MRRIIFDCDGIFSDFVGGVLKVVEQVTGVAVPPAELVDWDIFKSLVERFPGHPDLKKRLYWEIEKPGFCGGLDPYYGSLEALGRLQKLHHDKKIELIIATSPWDSSPTWMHERTMWLRMCGDIQARQVVHVHSKHVIEGDLFVDDKPEHVTAWQQHARGVALLWDTPHNRTAEERHGVRRVKGWDAFFEILENKIR